MGIGSVGHVRYVLSLLGRRLQKAFNQLQDELGTVFVTLFLQVFHLVQELLLEEELLYIERTLEKRFGRP